MEINHKVLPTVLSRCEHAKRSAMLFGTFGIGKSRGVRDFCEKLAATRKLEFVEWNKLTHAQKHELLTNQDKRSKTYCFVDIRLTLVDLGEFRLPSLAGANPWADWKLNSAFWLLGLDGTNGCLFLDEITQASPPIQATAFQIVYDRALGDVTFSPGVFVAAAGNRSEDKSGAFDIGLALRRRFANFELSKPTFEAWFDWALENDIDTRVAGYIKTHPGKLYEKIEDAMKSRYTGIATPATWEMASDLVKDIRILPTDSDHSVTEKLDVMNILVGGACGRGVGIEFTSFIKMSRTLDMDDLFKNPAKIAACDFDLKWSVLSSMAEVYRSNKKRLGDILGVLGHVEDDFSVSTMRMMLSAYSAGSKAKNVNAFVQEVMKAGANGAAVQKLAKYFTGVGK